MSDNKELDKTAATIAAPPAQPPAAADKDLDDLLDSLLDDFDKETIPVKTEPSNTNNTPVESKTKPTEDGLAEDGEWNEEFMAKYFEEQMATLLGEAGVGKNVSPDDLLNLGLQRLADAAQLVCQGGGATNTVGGGSAVGSSLVGGDGVEGTTGETNYADSIAQAIKGLKDGSEGLNSMMPPDDMASMFSGLQLNDSSGEANPFLPFVHGMMQSLLSAEVLLPSMKDLLEKYPTWLRENADKIDAADKLRYEKQFELFKVICATLESERPDDSAEVKNERFKKVLENMQKLHEHGSPPDELVGPNGLTNLAMPDLSALNDPSQCSIM